MKKSFYRRLFERILYFLRDKDLITWYYNGSYHVHFKEVSL